VRALALLAVLLAAAAAANAAPKPLTFSVFAKTSLPLGDVVWTGEQFVYVAERTGELDTSAADGSGLAAFAVLPSEYEEVRCAPSPGAHGWAAGELYCHGPHGEIWRVTADGSVTVFATLLDTKLQDGSLTFDTAGGFGHALLAASGGSAHSGGAVYAVGPDGRVRRLGSYPGPGGVENVELAPAGFGSVAGELLLAIDARGKGGRLLAFSPRGKVRLLAKFAHGINPIAAIAGTPTGGAARAGFYVSDTLSMNVYFLPAAQLAAYAGAVLVGGEKGSARFWVVQPGGRGFRAVRLHSNLEHLRGSWNFEGATYLP